MRLRESRPAEKRSGVEKNEGEWREALLTERAVQSGRIVESRRLREVRPAQRPKAGEQHKAARKTPLEEEAARGVKRQREQAALQNAPRSEAEGRRENPKERGAAHSASSARRAKIVNSRRLRKPRPASKPRAVEKHNKRTALQTERERERERERREAAEGQRESRGCVRHASAQRSRAKDKNNGGGAALGASGARRPRAVERRPCETRHRSERRAPCEKSAARRASGARRPRAVESRRPRHTRRVQRPKRSSPVGQSTG